MNSPYVNLHFGVSLPRLRINPTGQKRSVTVLPKLPLKGLLNSETCQIKSPWTYRARASTTITNMAFGRPFASGRADAFIEVFDLDSIVSNVNCRTDRLDDRLGGRVIKPDSTP